MLAASAPSQLGRPEQKYLNTADPPLQSAGHARDAQDKAVTAMHSAYAASPHHSRTRRRTWSPRCIGGRLCVDVRPPPCPEAPAAAECTAAARAVGDSISWRRTGCTQPQAREQAVPCGTHCHVLSAFSCRHSVAIRDACEAQSARQLGCKVQRGKCKGASDEDARCAPPMLPACSSTRAAAAPGRTAG